jgi:hypothetical protein
VIEVARGEFETARAAHAGRRVLAECGALDREFLTLGDGT